MNTSDFDYHLPRELIAQSLAVPRDASRMLVLDRRTGKVDHVKFFDVLGFFNAGDVLVMNDTKVLPARLFGKKPTGGRVEILLIGLVGDPDAMLRTELPISGREWHGYVRGKKIREGLDVLLSGGRYGVYIGKHEGGASFRLSFRRIDGENAEHVTLRQLLDELGSMPVPPYIKKTLETPSDYQTVYARIAGSVAAPTAGLHFTGSVLEKLERAGVIVARVTLHVGPGTFKPVSADVVEDHLMEKEYYVVGEECAKNIENALDRGGRLWVVGTTTMKTLETVLTRQGQIKMCSGNSDLFIYPPYNFLTPSSFFLTNFHLPRSTLLMMISAYAGAEHVRRAYLEAVEMCYRFYSFGDAMLIVG